MILAGGQGSRMAGADKGLQPYQGRPLIEHVFDALRRQTQRLLVSANRNLESYQSYGFDVVSDGLTNQEPSDLRASLEPSYLEPSYLEPRYLGPMAGVAAGIDYLSRNVDDSESIQSILVCSCDVPNLPADFAARLLTALQDSDSQVAVVHDGERTQNLHCMIHRNVWASLNSAFIKGERAMYRWQQSENVVEVDFSDHHSAFQNFNTLSSLSFQP